MTEQQRKAMEMALKFIVVSSAKDKAWYTTEEFELVSALRQALAQPEQEPVAWADKVGAVIPHSHKLFQPDLLKDYTRPLYTAPLKREWVGLTDEDKDELLNLDNWTDIVEAVEAKLKEKNT